jgi:hypothetical protein
MLTLPGVSVSSGNSTIHMEILMTLIPLAASLLMLTFAIVLSLQSRQESLLSLSAGALVLLGFGVHEIWGAFDPALPAGARNLHLAASIGFTSASALLARLAIRGFQARAARAAR